MTHPSGLGEYTTDELLQELASRKDTRYTLENAYTAKSVTRDENSLQNGEKNIKNITIDKPNN